MSDKLIPDPEVVDDIALVVVGLVIDDAVDNVMGNFVDGLEEESESDDVPGTYGVVEYGSGV